MPNLRVVILTALPVEFNAVRAHLLDPQEKPHPRGTVYEVGAFIVGERVWEVLIAEIGAGNDGAALEAERAISFWEPSVALFVGVAGGVKDVGMGDVVAATKIYGYESGKAKQGFLPRPDVGESSYALEQRARAVARNQDWRIRIKGELTTTPPQAFLGPIAAGEKVVSSVEADVFKFLKANYGDTLAIEMEGRGFLSATRANHPVQALVVRGISDLIDNKTASSDMIWQDRAARHASAFAFEILARLDVNTMPAREPRQQAPPDSPGARAVQTANVQHSIIITGNDNTVVMEREKSIDEKPTLQIGIPAQPEIFLGREEDMSELKARIGIRQSGKETGPLQVLTAVRGWPGIGKTAMATVFAGDADVQIAFPDGVLWASLGPDPKLIQEMAAWGRALGTDDILRAPTLKEATMRLSGLLRQKRVLMVVDDVWEVEHVGPFAQARGADCALLVTTRLPLVANGLTVPERAIYNLPALDEECAIELLGLLAPAVLKEHPIECKQLVRAVECLPLALHVAGRLLKAEAELGWGVVELMKELQTGKALIEAKAGANLMDLEQETIPSVATLLRKSTDRLDEHTRQCFAYLGPFAPKPATFDLAALCAMWEVDDPKPIVRELRNRGLLEPVGERFQMHALLVLHAKALLAQM